ncbi:MAG: hypothetical protein HWE22_14220 [Flavobacteriales bacterium]|nr:hypothetical protein [Flavobacteriales bacterium]
MKLPIIIGMCMSISCGALAQSAPYPNTRIENTQGLVQAEEGTYQFIIHDSKVMPAFTTNILYFIERERKQSIDVAIPLSENVTLFIPSREKINSENFEALAEMEL